MLLLKYASKKYHFAKKLIYLESAVGDTTGVINLWKNETNNGDHRILTKALQKQLTGSFKTQKTSVITIDNYLKQFHGSSSISFIKIDVQGYEIAVCEGMTDTLEANPNAVIGFEYCPYILKSLGFNPEDLISFFKHRGYEFYFLNNKQSIETYNIANTSLIGPNDYIELICARRNLLAN